MDITTKEKTSNWVYDNRISCVTGHGEVLFVAKTWRRILAVGIDWIILFGVFEFFRLFLSSIFHVAVFDFQLLWIEIFFLGFLWFGYFIGFLRFFSTTPGKYLFGLKVISIHFGKSQLGWIQVLIRQISDLFSVFFIWAPQSMALFRQDRRQMADFLAETQVVQALPRNEPATRRWIIGTILVIYFVFSGIQSFKEKISSFRLSQSGVYFEMGFKKGLFK